MPSEYARAHGMEGRNPYIRSAGHNGEQTVFHFLRRLVRKRYCKHVIGRHAEIFDYMRNPVRKKAGLSAARPRRHEYRTLGVESGRTLLFVQSVNAHLSASRARFYSRRRRIRGTC